MMSMTAIDINIYLFGIIVVVFAIIGFTASRRQKSLKDYFHDNSLFRNVVSLSATDITLGTGLVYLITGAQHNGILMLILPFMVWLGYYLQGEFIEKATSISLRTGKNILASIDDQIVALTSKKSPFASVVSASLVFVFVLVLAFEIFASSKVIAPFLFKTANVRSEIILSVIIFIITVGYSILGGISAVFRVDAVQVPLLILFIPIFFMITVPNLNAPDVLIKHITASVKYNSTIVTAVAIASINSITTQFYSILNWGAVSHMDPSKQKKMLRWVGFLSSLTLLVFVIIGLLHPVEEGKQVWIDITEKFSILASQQVFKAYLISGILILGMTSILLTTTDAVVITAIMFWYDNITKGDSKNTRNDTQELKKIRKIGVATFGICFSVLMLLNYLQPDPFYFLLSMAGGVVVFAPMIVTAGYLSSKGESLKIFTPKIIYTYFALFLISGMINVYLLAIKSPMVSFVGVFAFIISMIFSFFVVLKAIRVKSSFHTNVKICSGDN